MFQQAGLSANNEALPWRCFCRCQVRCSNIANIRNQEASHLLLLSSASLNNHVARCPWDPIGFDECLMDFVDPRVYDSHRFSVPNPTHPRKDHALARWHCQRLALDMAPERHQKWAPPRYAKLSLRLPTHRKARAIAGPPLGAEDKRWTQRPPSAEQNRQNNLRLLLGRTN